ncbi:MAG: [FeFe] hydrogenase H-cluster maturation GTPase HydF [Clostridia bacterium]
MGLNETPSADRVHIGFFGKRNVGKSSLVNAVTGQALSVVSDVKGTTTDPVRKAMELLPMGPVMIVDTPGIDDEGELGLMRVKKAKQVLNKIDVAVLVADVNEGLLPVDNELIKAFEDREVPYIIAMNKADTAPNAIAGENEILVSAREKTGIHELKERLSTIMKVDSEKLRIVGDLISPNDFVVLVTPIDSAAPKGRLILPQQQTIRDILEADAISVVVKEFQLKEALAGLSKRPRMVITDSQAFEKVSADTPEDIPLTSFSILMARYKGFLETAVRGAAAIDKLKDGDTVLISEGCSHHRQCDDIGTVKLPRWLRNYTKKELNIETSSGTEFPEDLSRYALVIHCGGCMLTEREVRYRMKCAVEQNTPFTNYGVAIAQMHGILKRSLSVFPDLADLLG